MQRTMHSTPILTKHRQQRYMRMFRHNLCFFQRGFASPDLSEGFRDRHLWFLQGLEALSNERQSSLPVVANNM